MLLAGAVIVLEGVHLHGEYVDESVESGSYGYGELYEDYLAAEGLFQGVDGAFPVGFLSVELVDGHHDGLLIVFSVSSENLSTYFHTLLGIDYEYTGVAYLERGDHSADEVVGTWSIHDGALVDLLDFGVVTDGVLRFYGSSAVNHFAFEHHSFRQGGFPRFGASQKHDISDVSGLVGFHFIKRISIS